MATLWTPSVLGSNLLLYTDPQVSGSLTLSGSDVVQMNDLSGNGRHVISDTGRRPVYNATGLNGRPSLDYGAPANRFYLYTTATLGALGTDVGSLAIYRQTGFWEYYSHAAVVALSTPGVATAENDPNTALLICRKSGDDNDLMQVVRNGSQTFAVDTPVVNNNSYIATTYFKPNNTVRQSLNGTPQTATYASTDFRDDLKVHLGMTENNISAFNTAWNAFISMVIVFKGCTDSDIEKLEGYAAWQYGMETFLPSDHPYRNAAPTLTESGGFTSKEAGLVRPFTTPFISGLF